MLGEWIGLSSLIATNAVINIGIYKYFNARLSKIYKRLDDVKEKIDIEFVRKDVCAVMHTQTANNLIGLESRVEKRIDKLESNIQDNLKEIMKILTKT